MDSLAINTLYFYTKKSKSQLLLCPKTSESSAYEQQERSSHIQKYTFHNTCVVRPRNFLNQIALISRASCSTVRFTPKQGSGSLCLRERNSSKDGARHEHVDETSLLRKLIGVLHSMVAGVQNCRSGRPWPSAWFSFNIPCRTLPTWWRPFSVRTGYINSSAYTFPFRHHLTSLYSSKCFTPL